MASVGSGSTSTPSFITLQSGAQGLHHSTPDIMQNILSRSSSPRRDRSGNSNQSSVETAKDGSKKSSPSPAPLLKRREKSVVELTLNGGEAVPAEVAMQDVAKKKKDLKNRNAATPANGALRGVLKPPTVIWRMQSIAETEVAEKIMEEDVMNSTIEPHKTGDVAVLERHLNRKRSNMVYMDSNQPRFNDSDSEVSGPTSSVLSGGPRYTPGRAKSTFAIRGLTMRFVEPRLEVAFGESQAYQSIVQYRCFLSALTVLLSAVALVTSIETGSQEWYEILGWMLMLVSVVALGIIGLATTFTPCFVSVLPRLLAIYAVMVPLITVTMFFWWSTSDARRDDLSLLDIFCWCGYVWAMIPFRYSAILPIFTCFVSFIFCLEPLTNQGPPLENYVFFISKVILLNSTGLFAAFLTELAHRRSLFARENLLARIDAVTSYDEWIVAVPQLKFPSSVYKIMQSLVSAKAAWDDHSAVNSNGLEERDIDSSEKDIHANARKWRNHFVTKDRSDSHTKDFAYIRAIQQTKFARSFPSMVVVWVKLGPVHPGKLPEISESLTGVRMAEMMDSWEGWIMQVAEENKVERLSSFSGRFQGLVSLDVTGPDQCVMHAARFASRVIARRSDLKALMKVTAQPSISVCIGMGSLSLGIVGSQWWSLEGVGTAMDSVNRLSEFSQDGTILIDGKVRDVIMTSGWATAENFKISNPTHSDTNEDGGSKGAKKKYFRRKASLDITEKYSIYELNNDEVQHDDRRRSPGSFNEPPSLDTTAQKGKGKTKQLAVEWDYGKDTSIVNSILAWCGLSFALRPVMNGMLFKLYSLNTILMRFSNGYESRYTKFSVMFYSGNLTTRGIIIALLSMGVVLMCASAFHGEGWDTCLDSTRCYASVLTVAFVFLPIALAAFVMSSFHPIVMLIMTFFTAILVQAMALILLAAFDSSEARLTLIRFNLVWLGVALFVLNIPWPYSLFYCAASAIVNEVAAIIVDIDMFSARGFLERLVAVALFCLFAYRRDIQVRSMYMLNNVLAVYEKYADARRDDAIAFLHTLTSSRIVEKLYTVRYGSSAKRGLWKRRRLSGGRQKMVYAAELARVPVVVIMLVNEGSSHDGRLLTDLHALLNGLDGLCIRNSVERVKYISNSYIVMAGADEEAPNIVNVILIFAVEAHLLVCRHNEEHGTKYGLKIGGATGALSEYLIGKAMMDYHVSGKTLEDSFERARQAECGSIHITEKFLRMLYVDTPVNEVAVAEVNTKGVRRVFFEGEDGDEKNEFTNPTTKGAPAEEDGARAMPSLSFEDLVGNAQTIMQSAITKYSLDHDDASIMEYQPSLVVDGKLVIHANAPSGKMSNRKGIGGLFGKKT